MKFDSLIKSIRITTGAARREDRQPSHDGEYITVFYRSADPTELIAEHNGGCFDIDDTSIDPNAFADIEEAELAANEAEAIHDEAHYAAESDSGEIATRCGSEARNIMISLGWIGERQFEGNAIIQNTDTL